MHVDNLGSVFDLNRKVIRVIFGKLLLNTILLADQNQDAMATSKFIKFESTPRSALAVIDLTSAYPEYASKATRGVALLDGRRAVLVQDEFKIKKQCELAWGMTTDAQITVQAHKTATLEQSGKKLIARILSPDQAGFTVESAEQEPPQRTNKGVRRLMVRIPDCSGDVRVAVLLSPVWKDGDLSSAAIKPLTEW